MVKGEFYEENVNKYCNFAEGTTAKALALGVVGVFRGLKSNTFIFIIDENIAVQLLFIVQSQPLREIEPFEATGVNTMPIFVYFTLDAIFLGKIITTLELSRS